MERALKTHRWKPVDGQGWARRAYGRRVMLETEGGVATSYLNFDPGPAGLGVELQVDGRMLCQIYQDDALICERLLSHEDCVVTFVPRPGSLTQPSVLELHWIPATTGSARFSEQLVRGKPMPVVAVSALQPSLNEWDVVIA